MPGLQGENEDDVERVKFFYYIVNCVINTEIGRYF